MTQKGGTVTFDAEEYLELLDEFVDLEKRLRSLGSQGFSSVKTTRPANKPKEYDTPAMVVHIDIRGVEWKTKDRQPAEPSDGWAWAFGYNKDGTIRRETNQLVQAVLQYGTVRIGQYEINLGGRDGNLLNRRKVKK
jgi:hypothetical protein